MSSDRRAFKTVFFFTLLVFVDMLFTMIVMSFLAGLVFYFDWIRLGHTNFLLPLFTFGIFSVIMGTLIARILGVALGL